MLSSGTKFHIIVALYSIQFNIHLFSFKDLELNFTSLMLYILSNLIYIYLVSKILNRYHTETINNGNDEYFLTTSIILDKSIFWNIT